MGSGLVPELARRQVVVVPKAAALANHWLGGAIFTLESGASSEFAYACTIATMPPHGGPAWHVHTREEEFFFIRRGTFEFEGAGADPIRIGPGGLITLPIGVPHRFANIADDEGEVVLWTSPGANAQFFLDLSNPLAEPDDATAPPDLEAMTAAGREYGIVMLGPDNPASQTILPLAGDRRPVATQSGEGETVAVGPGGATARVLAPAAATGGQCELVELTLPPGSRTPRLQHGRYTLGAVVQAGTVGVRADNGGDAPQELTAETDSLIRVPFGIGYRWANRTETPAVLLVLTSPGGWVEAWRSGDPASYGVIADADD